MPRDRWVTYLRGGPGARARAIEAVMRAPDGWRLEIREATRTLAQNDLMWSALGDVAAQVPWKVYGRPEPELLTDHDWKAIFTAARHEEARMAEGLRGGLVMLGLSTSQMPVSAMAEMISMIHAFGSERDVRWRPASIGGHS